MLSFVWLFVSSSPHTTCTRDGRTAQAKASCPSCPSSSSSPVSVAAPPLPSPPPPPRKTRTPKIKMADSVPDSGPLTLDQSYAVLEAGPAAPSPLQRDIDRTVGPAPL
jgi:hypothetical protein